MKKILFFAVSIMVMGTTMWGQSLNIGGHRAVKDARNNIWLCSVPQSLFGNDFTAAVSYGEELSEFVIDGQAVASGDTFVFTAIEGGKNYSVTAYMGDSLITGDITFTWLPIVELEGEFGEYYQYGHVTVNEPESTESELMNAKLRWSGYISSGVLNSKNKHSYTVIFVNEDSTKCDRTFFGLRNDSCWVLDAGTMDFLRVRTRVGDDLWLDMSRRPWYADTMPDFHNGSRGKMVEVLLNGSYMGIYNMCEPIDRKQLELKEYDREKKEFHGQLWFANSWTRTAAMSEPEPLNSTSYYWDGVQVVYPKRSDVGKVDWTVFYNAVQFAYQANLDEDMTAHADSMGYYFDLPVMQDFYIFIVALQSMSNETQNTYYSCYDKEEHPRLSMTPWDHYMSLGQSYNPAMYHSDLLAPDRPIDWVSQIPMIYMMLQKDYYNEVIARYRELRQTVLDTDNLVNRYRSAVDELETCGAAAREEARWSRDRDLAKRKLDLSDEMDFVEGWIRARMEYLDENVFIDWTDPESPTLKGDVNGDGEVSIADINRLIDIILGGEADSDTLKRADVNEDKEIGLADVNLLVSIILS